MSSRLKTNKRDRWPWRQRIKNDLLYSLMRVGFRAAQILPLRGILRLLGCLAPQVSRDAIQAWVIDSTMTESARLPDGAQVLLPKIDAILPILQAFNVGQ